MFRKLLVPVDGSITSLVAVSLAGRIAPDGEVTLLHARREGPLVTAAGLDAAIAAVTGAPSAARQRVQQVENEQSGELLAAARASLPPGVTVTSDSQPGRAADQVLERLEREKFDAVLVGSRGRGLIARSLLGSVSDAVLRSAPAPVFVVRRDELRRFVVAVDGSEASQRATRAAGELARRTGASVLLIHCLEFPIDTLVDDRSKVEQALRHYAARILTAAREALGEVPVVQEEFDFQPPAHAVLQAAERSAADLIVVGRHGPNPSRFAALGSVSHQVAMNAHASVLVVP